MEERNVAITQHLQKQDVQKRVLENMQRGRAEATVTISNAARLFGFTENQLRDWDEKGLLKPQRPTLEATQDSKGMKRRQYTPAELDKLAIIRELMNAGFSPGSIPADIDTIWNSMIDSNGQQDQPSKLSVPQTKYVREADTMPIDQRIQYAYYRETFWRYYASHALRLSLLLICEDTTFTRAGLILPFDKKEVFGSAPSTQDLPKVGESLVGWLGQSRSFYTFLTPAPTFQYSTDFHLMQLMAVDEDTPKDNTLIAVPRMEAETGPLVLNRDVVETVRRLLEPLYQEVTDWHCYLGQGMRDIVDPLIDFNSGTNLSDTILTGIAERVVRLGSKSVNGQDRWRFCCILVPNNAHLPLQQRSLVVRAKSKSAPSEYKLGTTLVSPEKDVISVSLRAFQSGRIIYRHKVTAEDTSVAHRELEEPIGSAIAVPIGAEDGLPIAALYVVSAEPDAFSQADQRVLRMIARMVEELLLTYQDRLQVIKQFTNLLSNPSVADPSFAIFASENEFISDVEELLSKIAEKSVASIDKTDIDIQYTAKEAVSFIAVDIDNQTSLTNKYGDRLTKNLSRLIGQQLQRQLLVLFTKPTDCKLYHIYADRFYLLLNGISLNEAREKARLLKEALNGSHFIDALRAPSEEPTPKSRLVSCDITIRLGVASYTYAKLQDLLERYNPETARASTAALIARALDAMLKVGQDEGGNVIISWYPELWGYKSWSPIGQD